VPRTARLDTPGLLHHIMIRGIERRKIFSDDNDRENLVERLSILLPETKTHCYAWAFLSNHAHVLFRSGPQGIGRLMRKLLTGYAVSYNRRHRRHGHSSKGGSSTFPKQIPQLNYSICSHPSYSMAMSK
jgi:putative transposase